MGCIWNALPESVVEAGPMTVLRKHQDEHINLWGIEGYGLHWVMGLIWKGAHWSMWIDWAKRSVSTL